MKFDIKQSDAYKVEIFIGGDYEQALDACEEFCTAVGLCVTVERTMYVYKGGRCEGVRIGLINYARFPKSHGEIWRKACVMANFLLVYLGQGSYTVQDHEVSQFYTERAEDGCSPS